MGGTARIKNSAAPYRKRYTLCLIVFFRCFLNNCLKAEENDVGIKGGMNIEYKEDDCISCGVCVKACRQDALKMVDGKIELDAQKCNHCGRCVKSCPVDAWKGTPAAETFQCFRSVPGSYCHVGCRIHLYVLIFTICNLTQNLRSTYLQLSSHLKMNIS